MEPIRFNKKNKYNSNVCSCCGPGNTYFISIRQVSIFGILLLTDSLRLNLTRDRQWRSSSFQESKKDLWPWPWAHPGCRLTRRPSCASLVAIRPFAWEKKRFAQKFTDGQTDGRTDDGRRAIALAYSWNELKKSDTIRKSGILPPSRSIITIGWEMEKCWYFENLITTRVNAFTRSCLFNASAFARQRHRSREPLLADGW